METSFYQNLKLSLLSLLGLSNDAVHIYIGLAVFVAWLVIFKPSRASFTALIPVIVVAMLMEIIDLRDDLKSYGHFHVLPSLHDIINTSFWPLIINIALRRGLLSSRDH